MMNKLRILLVACFVAAAWTAAEACTSLIVTKGASTDGSNMITYAADSHVLYGELYNQPAADHEAGAMREIREWDTNKHLGYIAEVAHTYATIGNMNEHGVTIAESTWGGREELEGSGLIDYGSLIYVTLQRARTAREAVDIMTSLVAEYGYASSGETFSIGDANEVWIMDLIGKGKKDKGAVWVARRVPDGYISGHANQARVHKFPLNDPETLYSPDVITFAREQGYFTGKDKDFSFAMAYAVWDFMEYRGCEGRVWAFYNKFMAPGEADRFLPWINGGQGEPMPLWVKPAAKISVNDMKWMMRDHFEGTDFDMTNDIGAGPFDVPYRYRPMEYEVNGQKYFNERAIATQQTGFSFVSSMNANRHAAMRGVLWFGVDDANTCVYVPVFNSTLEAPHELAVGNGDLLTLSWDSMFWVTNYVANQAYNRYSLMIPDIRRVQKGFEEQFEQVVDALAVNIAPEAEFGGVQMLLAQLTNQAAADVTTTYKQLGDYLLVKFLDGNVKAEDAPGVFSRTADGYPAKPSFPGYNRRYYESIANSPDGERLRVKE